MKYCKECERNVTAKKKFNWTAFWLWTLLFGAGIYIYLPWWILFGKKVCPICGCKL